MDTKKYIVIIPAYNPEDKLINLIRELKNLFEYIIVINDGSTCGQYIFEKLEGECILLNHFINLGKGRALKTGFNKAISLKKRHKEIVGVITVDADGQHRLDDIVAVSKELDMNNDSLILGCRNFECRDIPLRSKLGNKLTRIVFKWLCGINISDTQTGLRGIPISWLDICCQIDGEKYDYETNMLLTAKQQGWLIKEITITTIYEENNHTSHFNPLLDSIKIYKTILKYSAASLLSVVIDFSIFQLCYYNGLSLWVSTYIGRSCSAVVNFTINRRAVFHSNKTVVPQLLQYVLLVTVSGTLSAILIRLLDTHIHTQIIYIKMLVEIILYFFNYYVQSTFIFVKRYAEDKTDWTSYYKKKRSIFSTLTQQYTLNKIQFYIEKYFGNKQLDILECGGGNSCFAKQLCTLLNINIYDIIDNNDLGISLFREQNLNAISSTGIKEDLLSTITNKDYIDKYDFVYSVGVIEHFRGQNIETVIQNHFKYCKKNGYVLISFPTPTIQYCFTRKVMEILHVWQFGDEKPLRYEDVKDYFERCGNVKNLEFNKKLPLTQLIVVVQK